MSRPDESRSLRLNLCLLSAVGIWRPLGQGPVYWALRRVAYLLPVCAFAFWVRELGTVVRMRHDATQIVGYAGLFSGHTMSLYKWCALVFNRRQLRRLVDSLGACLQMGAAAEGAVELRPYVRAADMRATVLTVCWMLGAMYVVVYWSLTSLLSGLHGNGTSREGLQALWVVGSITSGWIHASCDCFYLHVITHLCSHFEFLTATLRHAEQYPELCACVRHHQHLLRAAKDLDATFSSLMCMQLFNTLLALCTFAFDVSTLKPGRGDSGLSSKAGFFAATVLQLYIYCRAGSRLTELGGQVADAGYDSLWLDKNPIWRRSVRMIIMQAQRSLRLTGGPFYVISYETMLSHLQLAFSYFTVLKNVHGRA